MSSESLPAGTHLLHIGPHKTGSTAIQVALFAARDEAARHGVHVPRGSRRRRAASEELFAARPAFDRPLPRWSALVDEVARASDQRVCVSDELFGKARGRLARRIVDDLGGADPHVVAVARRYDAYLPSQWQERVKAGLTASYDEWLRIVLGAASSWERRNVWTAHDTPALVRRWTRLVGPDRFTLVVADESDREQLPRVFEGLLGLPSGLLRADPARSNRSLPYPFVEVLRAVNIGLAEDGLTPRDHRREVNAAVRELMATTPTPPGPRKPPLPAWAVPVVRRLSEARAEAVADLPVRVIGDPDQLGHVGPADSATDELPEATGLADRVLDQLDLTGRGAPRSRR